MTWLKTNSTSSYMNSVSGENLSSIGNFPAWLSRGNTAVLLLIFGALSFCAATIHVQQQTILQGRIYALDTLSGIVSIELNDAAFDAGSVRAGAAVTIETKDLYRGESNLMPGKTSNSISIQGKRLFLPVAVAPLAHLIHAGARREDVLLRGADCQIHLTPVRVNIFNKVFGGIFHRAAP
jgi:hypothetical protein